MFLPENKTTRDFLRFDFISPALILQGVILMEIWKPIVGYKGLYEVSNFGRVKSFHKGGEPKLLNPNITKKGYLRATLFVDGTHKRFFCSSARCSSIYPKSRQQARNQSH